MGDKTQINTFRLPASLIEELKKEAGLEKINLNALVLKILANHVLWGRYERKVGLLPMTKPFVKAAIQRLDNDEIIKLALNIEKETFSNILHFMKGEYTVNDFIEILRAWLNVAWMQHNIEQTNNSYIFKIQHDLGDKWSLYVETLIKELFADILKKKLEIKSKKGNIMLIFPSE
jgi:hypothetical protein